MGKRLENKTALITGGGTGIGAATAKRFAREGACVYISGRREQPLETVVNAIRKSGGIAHYRVSDAGDEQAVDALFDGIVDERGGLDILVNNAVSMAGGGLVADTTAEDWDGTFRVTTKGMFFCVRAALKVMQRQSGGSIVNISSVCGLLGTPYTGAYSAAKAAVIGFSRTTAIEAAAANIRVNTVVPGMVMTPPTAATLPNEEAKKASAASVPIGRIGDPDELAHAIVFLASDEASYITGTELIVDGGKSAELNTGAANVAALEI